MDNADKNAEMGMRIRAVRTLSRMSQQEFAKSLGSSKSYLSGLENGAKEPQETLLQLLVFKFALDEEWLYKGTGDSCKVIPAPSISESAPEELVKAQKRKNLARDALVAAAVMGPVMPYLAGTIAIGVGAANILGKLCKAYGAKNITSLAKDHLQVDRTTLDYWLRKDEVPKTILQKAIDEKVITAEEIANCDDYLIINKAEFSRLIKERCKDGKGQDLDREFVEELLSEAKVTREE